MDGEDAKERKRAAGKRYYEANRESILAKTQSRRAANPGSQRETNRRYREANREKKLLSSKARYEANREKILAAQKHRREKLRADAIDGKDSYYAGKRAAAKRFYAANRENLMDKQRQRNMANPEARRAVKQRYLEKNPKQVRVYLLSRYGLTQQDYDRMMEAQNYSCAICGVEAWVERDAILHIDHDHDTGKVRDLLCGKCNRGLGMFLDSPQLVGSALAYLKRHK